MAPLKSQGAFPFNTFDKWALRKLLTYAINSGKKHLPKSTQKCIIRHYCERRGNRNVVTEGVTVVDILKPKYRRRPRTQWELSPTFRTDGSSMHLIWQCPIIKEVACTQREKDDHEAKRLKHEKTWTDEVERARKVKEAEEKKPEAKRNPKAKTEPDRRKRLFLDKEPKVHEPDTTVYPSNDVDAFNDKKPGLYSRKILEHVDQNTISTVDSFDPGRKDLMSGCRVTDFTPSADPEAFDPQKGSRLTSKEFYNRTRVKTPRNDDLNARLSQCSLKTSSYEIFLKNLRPWLRLTNEVFEAYGTRQLRAKKFLRYKKKRQFYDTVADRLVPDKNSLVLVGNGYMQVTMKGTSTCPTAKIIRHVAAKRRTVLVREAYTTQKCSCCRDARCSTNKVPATHIGPGVTRSGRSYPRYIHGLRQCPHCLRTWNRDFNASRGIFFSGLSEMNTGERAAFLAPAPP